MRQWGIPLTEVAAMARHLPLESATYRTSNPHWQRSIEVDLLRQIEYLTRVSLWRNSSGSTLNRPEPIPLPWDPEPEGSIRGDRMSLEEAADWLGWGVS